MEYDIIIIIPKNELATIHLLNDINISNIVITMTI